MIAKGPVALGGGRGELLLACLEGEGNSRLLVWKALNSHAALLKWSLFVRPQRLAMFHGGSRARQGLLHLDCLPWTLDPGLRVVHLMGHWG